MITVLAPYIRVPNLFLNKVVALITAVILRRYEHVRSLKNNENMKFRCLNNVKNLFFILYDSLFYFVGTDVLHIIVFVGMDVLSICELYEPHIRSPSWMPCDNEYLRGCEHHYFRYG